MIHIPGNRECKKVLPIVILIGGKSSSGKSTVSYYLNKADNVKYFSLDAFTLDPNIPIPSLKKKVEDLGENAYLKIPQLEKYVFDNMDIFIQYCYDVTLAHDSEIFIFDGVYFNNKTFLNLFSSKFKNSYKLWTMTPS